MKIPIWYCEKDSELELPDNLRVDLFDLPRKRLAPLKDFNPGAVPASFKEFVAKAQKLLIVINDHYRPTPTARLLELIAGILPIERTTFLVATGLHSKPGGQQLRQIFGEAYLVCKERVRIHDAYDEADLYSFGSGDRTVRLNRQFADSDSVLLIGSVEPHYFAGFTGGRKIILPGCASFADVSRNHAHALSSKSQPMARRGNPVWDDINVRTACLDYKQRYAIQAVCDHHGELFHLAWGEWDHAYDSACEFVKTNYAYAAAAPYDVVVSVVYPPLDRNLYQLQKSYENVAAAVKDGGTILLVSCCSEGTGDSRFLELAERAANGDLEQSEWMLMGIHKVKRTQRLTERLRLVLVSTLPESDLKFLPIAPRSDLQQAMEELIEQYDGNCSIAVVLDSASQVLYRT